MFTHSPIVLRKVNGRFDACSRTTVRAIGVGAAPSLLATVGAVVRALLMPGLVLAAIALVLLFAPHHAPVAGVGLLGITATDEVKKLIDELNTAFVDFKNKNDERLKQIETRGSADAALVNGVENANKAISKMQGELKDALAKLAEVETAQARQFPAGSPEARQLEAKHAAKFFSMTRGEPVEHVSDDDLTTYRAYKKALNNYIRRGSAALNDSGIRNALSTGSATTGGFWVTPDVSGRIVELVFQTSPVRQLAAVQTIGTDALEGWNDLDEPDSGWVGEQQARTETNTPQAQTKWSIPMHEQYANPKVSQKQLDDSFFDVEGWLTRKVSSRLSRQENLAYVSGDGILKPKGFLCSAYQASAITGKQSKSTWGVLTYLKSGAAGDFAAADPGDKIIDLIAALKVEYRSGAVFACNTTTLAAIRKLKDGQGNYLMIPGFSNAFTTGVNLGTATVGGIAYGGQLLGFPVAELQDMDDIAANSFSLAFGNFAEAYQIIDHATGIRVLRDPYTAKPYVQVYTTKRTGGDVVNFEALKLMKFAA